MKFYLTKAAQRAAESGTTAAKAPEAAKPERVRAEKLAKPEKVRSEKVRSAKVRPEKTPRTEKPSRAEKPTRGSQAATASVIAGQPAPTAAPAYASAPVATLPPSAPSAGTPASPMRPAAPQSATALLEPAAAPEAPTGGRPAKVAKTPAVKKQSSKIIAIGGEARVDLLPAEVRAERRAGVQVRRVWLGVAALVVVVGIVTGAATLYAQQATSALTAAQNQTASLSAQTAQYSSVKTIQGQVTMIKAAQEVGGSTDIDWTSYLTKVESTLPSGMVLSTVTIDSASPVASYAQASGPLQGQRVGTLTFTATSTTLPSVPSWLTNLATLPGYVDATAGDVTLSGTTYTSNVTVHINQKAFSNAYASKGK